MGKMKATVLCLLLVWSLVFCTYMDGVWATQSGGPTVTSPSVILMEASTGTVIFEKNSDEKLHPASVTKIMTLLLIFDAIEEGKITLEDSVSVSEHAASMGGSQVFLEPGGKHSLWIL